ncbi:hypothetical protein BO221_24235 [Archangium sp. Cb G35]|uniref:hypothetical protein n=1 Tax=Archangium sp. Cb G35 TaxID=1920190 RepID=UPI000936152F|nr:hypothetical protein [Archangium sp. Cb G35]OJT21874.1 hypothetical protein BO221_24235 [Archangium sp. Cb G35]
MKMNFWVAGTVALALGAVGCQPPAPEPEEVAEVTAKRSGDLVRNLGSSMRTLSNFSALKLLTDVASSVGGFGNMGGGVQGLSITRMAEDSPMPVPSIPDETTSQAQAALVEKYLRERIFIEANVEETKGSSTTFRITGEDLCSDGSTPAAPACVAEVDKYELRIRATNMGDKGLDLELLFGPNRAEPLSLSFSDVRVGMIVDLGGVKDTVTQLSPETELPRVMVGRVELALTSTGPRDVEFQTSILDALSVEWDGAAGAYAFSSAKASPLTEMKVWQKDGANQARIALNLGTTEIRIPYSGPETRFSGQQYVVSLSGLSYNVEAHEGREALTLAHVGLGEAQSYLALGDHKLVTVDLNALSGRHFDLHVEKGADGLAVLSARPEFDLSVFTDMGPLYVDEEGGASSGDSGSSFNVRLSGGDAPSVRPVPANTSTGFPGGLQVVSGELSVTVNESRVTVPASQCLVRQRAGSEPSTGTGYEVRDCQ